MTQQTDAQDLESLAESLDRGQIVNCEYRDADGDTVSHTGAVAKANKGGIRIILKRSLRNIQTAGLVLETNLQGNGRSRRVGNSASVEPTGETVDVRYDNRTGWEVDE